MTENSENKSFKIEGDSKKRVVRFGVSKAGEQKKETLKEELPREELKEGEYPKELVNQFNLDKEFKDAFEKLEQGAKSGYLIYFAGPTLTASITNRIAKKIERIKNGHSLNACICGLSKSMPNCDGSHKNE